MSPGKLLVLAGLCALTAAAAGATGAATAGETAETRLLALASAAFATGPWRWLLYACGISIGFVTVLRAGLAIAGLKAVRGRVSPGALAKGSVRHALEQVQRRIASCTAGPEPDMIAAFDELLRGAVSVAASDIHISPAADALKMTYRVHGSLYEVAELPRELSAQMATRVKVLARLDTYVRGVPQDGRMVRDIDGESIEARVSSLPTELGERLVLRLVRGGRTVPDLGELGFPPAVSRDLLELLTRPQGLIFVTGSVGSGKTTTLYACLKHIAAARGRTTTLVTLEDPIELELPFATQTQMHLRAGMTFASVLRSVLRQDPNVLMIGEIRDRETAEIAMQAGLTGHLILTTVHGESAAGPFARLVDLDIEPFILASATLGSLSQRLVRTLCTACRRAAPAEPIHRDRFARHGFAVPDGDYYEAVGCAACEGQGFVGRAPIAELLVMNAPLRQALNERRPTRDLNELAVEHGMVPLLLSGLERARAGETSLTEVLRVAG